VPPEPAVTCRGRLVHALVRALSSWSDASEPSPL